MQSINERKAPKTKQRKKDQSDLNQKKNSSNIKSIKAIMKQSIKN
jgi:hypothetical protein